MFGRKRRREMVRVFREQVDFLHAQDSALADAVLTHEEIAALKKKSEQLREDVQKIAPPLPLTWKELLARFSFVGIGVVIVGVVVAQRLHLVAPSLAPMESSGTADDATEYRYIPYTSTNVSDFSLVSAQNFSAPVLLAEQASRDGGVVGVFPNDVGGVTALYTLSAPEGVRLVRRTLNDVGMPLTDEATVYTSSSLVDVSVATDDDGYVVAFAEKSEEATSIRVQGYDATWAAVGDATIIQPAENEYIDGLTLNAYGWEDATYALLTIQTPGENATMLDTRKFVLRLFADDLSLLTEMVLDTPSMNVDAHASFLPGSGEAWDGSYTILANGGPPLDIDRIQKGDEIIALVFNAQHEAQEYFRITNNGRPHDFWPENSVQSASGYVYFPYIRQPLAPKADVANELYYPTSTGQAFVGIVKPPTFATVGTLFIADYRPQPAEGGEARQGATRLHFTIVGKRLFALYDVHTIDDPYADGEKRQVFTAWFDLQE